MRILKSTVVDVFDFTRSSLAVLSINYLYHLRRITGKNIWANKANMISYKKYSLMIVFFFLYLKRIAYFYRNWIKNKSTNNFKNFIFSKYWYPRLNLKHTVCENYSSETTHLFLDIIIKMSFHSTYR